MPPNRRMPFVVGPFALCCISFSVMLGLRGNFENQIGGTYFSVMLACMGIYPSAPALIAWVGNNLAPASRRAVGLGLNICLGNAGGVMGSYMFFDSDSPQYSTGFGLSLAFGVTGLLAAVAAEVAYMMANMRGRRCLRRRLGPGIRRISLWRWGIGVRCSSILCDDRRRPVCDAVWSERARVKSRSRTANNHMTSMRLYHTVQAACIRQTSLQS